MLHEAPKPRLLNRCEVQRMVLALVVVTVSLAFHPFVFVTAAEAPDGKSVV
jgi:hypothetical protein